MGQLVQDELGLALESFLFLDDNPVERDRVRQRLPEVEVWGDDPFALRRKLLSDPRLSLLQQLTPMGKDERLLPVLPQKLPNESAE